MPLIRALRGWISRRMAVNETLDLRGAYDPSAGMHRGRESAGATWGVIMLAGLPLIATLVVIGVVYESVIRIDRPGLLPSAVRWALATVVGILVVAGPLVVAYRWLFPALAQ